MLGIYKNRSTEETLSITYMGISIQLNSFRVTTKAIIKGSNEAANRKTPCRSMNQSLREF